MGVLDYTPQTFFLRDRKLYGRKQANCMFSILSFLADKIEEIRCRPRRYGSWDAT